MTCRIGNVTHSTVWPGPGLFVALSLACTAGMMAARYFGVPRLVLPMTLLASTGFLFAAWAAGAFQSGRGRLLFMALAGCWAGDLLGPGNFVLGAVCFLFAHLAFIAAFSLAGFHPRRMCVASLSAALLAAFLLGFFWPGIPLGEQALVAAYVLVISGMVVTVAASKSVSPLFLAAALLFYVSDIFVARWRYGEGGALNGYICYPLYYLACNLFALGAGVFLRCGDRRRVPVLTP